MTGPSGITTTGHRDLAFDHPAASVHQSSTSDPLQQADGGLIFHRDPGCQGRDPSPTRFPDQRLEEQSSNALALPPIDHRESELDGLITDYTATHADRLPSFSDAGDDGKMTVGLQQPDPGEGFLLINQRHSPPKLARPGAERSERLPDQSPVARGQWPDHNLNHLPVVFQDHRLTSISN
jgi:hypothetical protein